MTSPPATCEIGMDPWDSSLRNHIATVNSSFVKPPLPPQHLRDKEDDNGPKNSPAAEEVDEGISGSCQDQRCVYEDFHLCAPDLKLRSNSRISRPQLTLGFFRSRPTSRILHGSLRTVSPIPAPAPGSYAVSEQKRLHQIHFRFFAEVRAVFIALDSISARGSNSSRHRRRTERTTRRSRRLARYSFSFPFVD